VWERACSRFSARPRYDRADEFACLNFERTPSLIASKLAPTENNLLSQTVLANRFYAQFNWAKKAVLVVVNNRLNQPYRLIQMGDTQKSY
jgi:hypothetical protein